MLGNSVFFQPSRKFLETGKTNAVVEELTKLLRLILFLLIFACAAHAQQSSGEEDEDLIKSSRPTLATDVKTDLLEIAHLKRRIE